MLLSAERLSINFGSRQLLQDVNFYLNEGDKTGIIGINGTGKSTFLKVLVGELSPDKGTVTRNPNVQVSYLPQNPPMEDEATVLEQVFLHFPAEFRELNEYEAKTMLTRLGITDFDQKIGLDLLSMAPPIRARSRFSHSQSLPSGSFHKPLILIPQRADRMETTITEN